ncbi:hypothetical protein E2C01_096746 [Portunus trituberculatus]|uniref:Uncharacterized protein n=1 Tax=Portunus trituberculatus TaxID=210409 RepID=A0A5B7K7M9_PORTR|nr:hypothetical protein [Portunus trituberculatus]
MDLGVGLAATVSRCGSSSSSAVDVNVFGYSKREKRPRSDIRLVSEAVRRSVSQAMSLNSQLLPRQSISPPSSQPISQPNESGSQVRLLRSDTQEIILSVI